MCKEIHHKPCSKFFFCLRIVTSTLTNTFSVRKNTKGAQDAAAFLGGKSPLGLSRK